MAMRNWVLVATAMALTPAAVAATPQEGPPPVEAAEQAAGEAADKAAADLDAATKARIDAEKARADSELKLRRENERLRRQTIDQRRQMERERAATDARIRANEEAAAQARATAARPATLATPTNPRAVAIELCMAEARERAKLTGAAGVHIRRTKKVSMARNGRTTVEAEVERFYFGKRATRPGKLTVKCETYRGTVTRFQMR
jgi:hypothetical protein